MSVHGVPRQDRSWSDLPGDLLSVIYLRSVSAYDRARFAAVCSPWRAAAAWNPRLPALPLLLASTGDGKRDQEARVYSPEDGRVLRVPLPWFPWGNRLVGSYQGGWIATVSGSGGLLVVNIFSGARAARLDVGMIFVRKIVFNKDPSSAGCVIAAMKSMHTVGVRRVDSAWTTWRGHGVLLDIAFCKGELYGVTSGDLIVFHIGMDEEGGAPVTIRSFFLGVAMSEYLYTPELSSAVKYIFELHGKLAIAVKVGRRGHGWEKSHFFRIFELTDNDDDDDDTTRSQQQRYSWDEVTSLGDHALFLGPANCKAEHISEAGRRGGVEGNRIYYLKQHTYLQNNTMEAGLVLASLDMGSCTVHCWEIEESKHHLERIVSRGYHYSSRKDQDGANGCLWLWPSDF